MPITPERVAQTCYLGHLEVAAIQNRAHLDGVYLAPGLPTRADFAVLANLGLQSDEDRKRFKAEFHRLWCADAN